MSLYGHFSQSARKGYVNYFPSPLTHKFTGEEVQVKIEAADMFVSLQRHLLRIDHMLNNYVK